MFGGFFFRFQFFSTPIRQIIIIIIITDFEQLAKEEEENLFLLTELAFPRSLTKITNLANSFLSSNKFL